MKSQYKMLFAWIIREHRAWEIHDGQTMAYELFPQNLHNYAGEYFTCIIYHYVSVSQQFGIKHFSTKDTKAVQDV